MKNLIVLSRLTVDFISFKVLKRGFITDIFYTYEYMNDNNINVQVIDLAFKLYQY